MLPRPWFAETRASRASALAGVAACSIACGTERAPRSSPSGARALPAVTFSLADGSLLALGPTREAPNVRPWLLLRVVAAWCGTCRWSAEHTPAAVPAEFRDQVEVIDVLLAGQDNAPPDAQDLAAWRELSGGAALVVADPAFQLRSLFPERSALPLVALVERSSMRALQIFSDPAPEELAHALASAEAERTGEPPARPATPVLWDGLFSSNQWGMIQQMVLGGPPPDPSNAVADDPRAAALGKALFFERRLSPEGVSCSSCHQPELLFTDGKATPPEGAERGERNVPSTLLAGDQPLQLWDGRADSAWMQALLPIESPVEFASTRLYTVHALFDQHREEYEEIFGPLPPLNVASRFPPRGAPGDATWATLSEADRESVNRAFVGIGKAIAAYERGLRPRPNALDAYAGGQLDALSAQQKDGLLAFFEAGCAQCHYGPRLTDDSFHNLRFPTGRHDRIADPGRVDGVTPLSMSEFHRGGRFSDAPSTFAPPRSATGAVGSFKTPGLRGVGFTLPYGHGGSYWGLTSVLEAIRTGGLPLENRYAAGEVDPFLRDFDAALIPPLVTFLSSLRIDVEL